MSKLSDAALRSCLTNLTTLSALDLSGTAVLADDILRQVMRCLEAATYARHSKHHGCAATRRACSGKHKSYHGSGLPCCHLARQLDAQMPSFLRIAAGSSGHLYSLMFDCVDLQVSTSLVQLQHLTAQHCQGIKLNNVFRFQHLRSLDLSGCDALTPARTVRGRIFLRS